MPLPVLRVKRKATDDPVNALYLELGHEIGERTIAKKRKSSGRYFFRLSQTLKNDKQYVSNVNAVRSSSASDLLESTNVPSKPPLPKANSYGIPIIQPSEPAIPKVHSHMDLDVKGSVPSIPPTLDSPRFAIQNLPSTKDEKVFDAIRLQKSQGMYHTHPQLDSMIHEYLSNGDLPLQQAREEYVYDIYEASNKEPSKPPTGYGVIDALSVPDAFRESLENELVSESHDAEEEDPLRDEIDEDSNAESFYQNSYPDEDEWGGSSEHSFQDDFASDENYADGLYG
ncbi:RNA polymerase II associated protein [Schizosaccharomyces cryophilus OY26]|uniref:RNA polymerase II associated protein n=1 Tax=Schizosaccharomyces cryophilus (strain OY26 / ATCC MYA-4695 / CBS 11777 / NBRC 106824 / NRRL Y48691) TaxID=653667 RepID=S9VYX1_SCHCR|nr:RNA polymerase II associated protein [Schizosaccharomyces cryophilus OY26]EPY51020.1 RNA polymerase II associated protein [Schizosaccharomyces cryophilus OY26]